MSSTTRHSLAIHILFASSSSSSFVSFLIVFTRGFLSTSNIRTKIGVKAMPTIDVIYRVNSIKRPPKKASSSSQRVSASSGHLRSARREIKRKKTNRREPFRSLIILNYSSIVFPTPKLFKAHRTESKTKTSFSLVSVELFLIFYSQNSFLPTEKKSSDKAPASTNVSCRKSSIRMPSPSRFPFKLPSRRFALCRRRNHKLQLFVKHNKRQKVV